MRWVSLRLFSGASYSTALKANYGARWFWVNLIGIRRYVYATFYKLFCIPQNEFITIIPPPNSFYSTPSLFDNYVTKPQFKSDLVEEKRGG